MRLAIPVIQKIVDYGAMNFQSEIQRHVKHTFSGMDISGVNPSELYHGYAHAYVLAVTTGDFESFLDAATDDIDSTDESLYTKSLVESVPVFSLEDKNTQVGFELQHDMEPDNPTLQPTLLNLPLSENEYVLAVGRVHELFTNESLSQTGLLSIVKSMVPGDFIDYRGDDLNNLVIETETGFTL